MEESVIRLENVSFSYDQKLILENINLNINRGMILGIVVMNGGEKTTLIKIIIVLVRQDQGNIYIQNNLNKKFKNWNKIGFVTQKANTFNKGLPATVYEVVSMGLTAKLGYLKRINRKMKQKVLDAIDLVDMGEYAYQN